MNYNNIMNIENIVKCLKVNNIKRVVISPGGTNIPFVKAVQDDSFFECYSIVDERSAMYFALGLYLQTGEIIATSCTSAQATRNYVPGLTEAFYKHAPILAITMSKHPRFTYQEYMQAPDQASLPKDCVKCSFTLPYLRDKNDMLQSVRTVNEAILELTHNGTGPVQLCVPMLDFPLEDEEIQIRNIRRYTEDNDWSDVSICGKKIMLVMGEHRPYEDTTLESIEHFCKFTNSMVYVNHLSNYHGIYSVEGNLTLLTTQPKVFEAQLQPDVIITLGGQTGDYPLYNMLSLISLKKVEHWRICDDGNVVDTYDKLTKVFQCSANYFFRHLNYSDEPIHEYYDIWKQFSDSKSVEIDLPFSNAYVAQKMHQIIPANSTVNFAILNSLRIWNLFSLDSSIICHSNVGAFGIDGGMSTLIGESIVNENLCFMITGDLAFYYDMNSLAIRYIGNNVRILLINNNGGIEFKQNTSSNVSIDRYIAAANHFKNAEGWANTCGFQYYSAKNKDEFEHIYDKFLDNSSKPVLFEVFVSDSDEARAYHELVDNNTQYDMKDLIKKSFKSSIKKILK